MPGLPYSGPDFDARGLDPEAGTLAEVLAAEASAARAENLVPVVMTSARNPPAPPTAAEPGASSSTPLVVVAILIGVGVAVAIALTR
jgi:hypothetical protein